MSTFFHSYLQRKEKIRSLLCVGLDPDPRLLPQGYNTSCGISASLDFLTEVIESTAPFSTAYKANCAFFEALGPKGMELFAQIVQVVRKKAPGALFIADAKRGDVEHSAQAYARAFFEKLDCDAVTLNPYMGMDCLEPFFSYKNKAAMILCCTSNAGAGFFQSKGSPPLYLQVAEAAAKRCQSTNNLWLVVGATQKPEAISAVRKAAPDVPFLIPGVGKQGGKLEECLSVTGTNVLINAGRSILYASQTREGMHSRIHAECQSLLSCFQKHL